MQHINTVELLKVGFEIRQCMQRIKAVNNSETAAEYHEDGLRELGRNIRDDAEKLLASYRTTNSGIQSTDKLDEQMMLGLKQLLKDNEADTNTSNWKTTLPVTKVQIDKANGHFRKAAEETQKDVRQKKHDPFFLIKSLIITLFFHLVNHSAAWIPSWTKQFTYLSKDPTVIGLFKNKAANLLLGKREPSEKQIALRDLYVTAGKILRSAGISTREIISPNNSECKCQELEKLVKKKDEIAVMKCLLDHSNFTDCDRDKIRGMLKDSTGSNTAKILFILGTNDKCPFEDVVRSTWSQRFTAIAEILLRSGADANDPNSNGITPLHGAILSENTKTVKLLLDNKANINAQCNKGRTPMHTACAMRPGCTILTLLALHSGDMNVKDNSGNTALHVCDCQSLSPDFPGRIATNEGLSYLITIQQFSKANPATRRMSQSLTKPSNIGDTPNTAVTRNRSNSHTGCSPEEPYFAYKYYVFLTIFLLTFTVIPALLY